MLQVHKVAKDLAIAQCIMQDLVHEDLLLSELEHLSPFGKERLMQVYVQVVLNDEQLVYHQAILNKQAVGNASHEVDHHRLVFDILQGDNGMKVV